MKTFSVIGAGRLGTALALALTRKGFKLKFLSDRIAGEARASRKIIGQGRATTDNLKAARTSALVLICVPDDGLKSVVNELAEGMTDGTGQLILHTSGIHSSRLLAPLQRKGADVASVHPVQSFPAKAGPLRLFRGIYWGVEAKGKARDQAQSVVRKLGGHVLFIDENSKALYHAACSLASNAFVALEEAAASLLQHIGLSKKQAVDVLLPLVQGSLQNVKNLGLEEALTGPVVRGDVQTVKRHLEALEIHPRLREVYKNLARQAFEKRTREDIKDRKIKALKRLLEDKSLPPPGERRRS